MLLQMSKTMLVNTADMRGKGRLRVLKTALPPVRCCDWLRRSPWQTGPRGLIVFQEEARAMQEMIRVGQSQAVDAVWRKLRVNVLMLH